MISTRCLELFRQIFKPPWQGRQIKALQSINDVSIQDSYPAIWSDRDVFQSYSNEIMAMSQTFHMKALGLDKC